MRKIIMFTLFVTMTAGVLGQTPIPQPYLALLLGTTLNSETAHSTPYPWFVQDRERTTGFLGSVEGGFPMTRYIGVHFGYVGTSQHFTLRQTVSGYPYAKGSGSIPLNILEVGPEFLWNPTPNQQLYAQLNMGHTFGSATASTIYTYRYYSYQRDELLRDNAWSLGLAVGYRWYFSKAVGLSVQVTYHQVSGGALSPIWAAQAGVVFRF